MVYLIAPVDDLSKVKTMHRWLLKRCVQRDSPKVLPVEELVEPPGMSSQEEEEEVHLLGVIPIRGQVVLSVVSDTSIVPLPTCLPSSMCFLTQDSLNQVILR